MKMKIILNSNFYKKEAIEEAISAFSEICSCKILNDSFEIELTPETAPSEELEGEFCNFVLGIAKDNMMF